MLGIDNIAFAHTRSREVHIQVKTKTNSRFVRHMQVSDERLPEPKDEREFYVFVELETGANANAEREGLAFVGATAGAGWRTHSASGCSHGVCS